MLQRRLLVISSVLISAALAAGQSRTLMSAGTSFGAYNVTGAPCRISALALQAPDVVTGGVLRNASEKRVLQYRIGWRIAYPWAGKPPQFGMGGWNVISGGMAPGETRQLARHRVEMPLFTRDTRQVGIFVAEVKFSDGSLWLADLRKLK